ncbi:MAG: clostripain-related cysteine peptidase [Candidatus Hodarchaeota archaeon]
MKKWTFMVYLAGDNNLEGCGTEDINEMEQAGSTDDVNILAQFDRIRGYDPSNEDWRGTKRFYITKGASLGKIESEEVGDLGETNMGDPKVLENFIEWGMDNYPAEKYALIIWNHGSGWKEDDVYRVAVEKKLKFVKGRYDHVDWRNISQILFSPTLQETVTVAPDKSIAFDDSNRDFLDNKELRNAIHNATKGKKKIDVLGMDACLMAMIEVIYYLRNYVSVVVASQEVEPGDGWPYERICTKLVKNPEISGNELAKIIVKEYLKSYEEISIEATQSAISTEHLETFSTQISNLAAILLTKIQTPDIHQAIFGALQKVKRFYDADYIDLYDFCRLIHKKVADEKIKQCAKDVMDAFQKVIVEEAHNEKAEIHGLAIYWPQYFYNKKYDSLEWSKKTKWDDLIRKYLDV